MNFDNRLGVKWAKKLPKRAAMQSSPAKSGKVQSLVMEYILEIPIWNNYYILKNIVVLELNRSVRMFPLRKLTCSQLLLYSYLGRISRKKRLSQKHQNGKLHPPESVCVVTSLQKHTGFVNSILLCYGHKKRPTGAKKHLAHRVFNKYKEKESMQCNFKSDDIQL